MATSFVSLIPILVKMMSAMSSSHHGGGGGGGESGGGAQTFNAINSATTSFPGPPDEIGDMAMSAGPALSAEPTIPPGQPGLESLFGPNNPYSSGAQKSPYGPASPTDPFRLLKMAMALSAGGRGRSAQSAAGAAQFINALQAMNKPQKEGDQFQQAIQAILGNTRSGGQTTLPTFPAPAAPSMPSAEPSFPGPPNEVGDGQVSPIIIPGRAGLIQPNPATQGAQNEGLPAGLTQDQIRMALQATAMINQGQQLQKLVDAKELQPTLIEALMSGKGMAPGLAYKQEARQHLRLVQLAAIKNLIDSGQGHLAEAFFRTMSPEEQSNLAHRHMSMLTAATALQRAQAQPYLNTFGPVNTGEQALAPGALNPALALPGQGGQPGAPIPYGPGEQRPGQPSFSPGTAGATLAALGQRQATPSEAQERFDLALQDPKRAASMAVAYGAAAGLPLKPETLQQEMQRNLQLRTYNTAEPLVQKAVQDMRAKQAGQAGQQATIPAKPAIPAISPAPGAPQAPPVPQAPGAPLPRHRQDLEDAADAQAQAHGIPASFLKGLIDTENSKWQPRINNARFGRSGGMGLMQIVPRTWEKLKSRVGLDPDPYDGKHSIIAGTSLITELQQKYGEDWPRIAAAYQAGPDNIPLRGPIPKDVTVYGPGGQPVLIHPADYSDKVIAKMRAREQGIQPPAWTEPGVVPAGQLDQARAAGLAPPSPTGQPQGQPPTTVSTPEQDAAYRAANQQPSGQTQGQGQPPPFTLPDYAQFGSPVELTGMHFAPAGVSMDMKFTSQEQKAGAYAQNALLQGGWRSFVPALQKMAAEGAAPLAPDLLRQLREQASNQAYWEFRNVLESSSNPPIAPDLHRQALAQASRATGGFFAGQGLSDLQDPVALRRAETLAGLQAGGEYATSQLGKEARQLVNADDVRKAVDQHNQIVEATLDEKIIDPALLSHYQGAQSGMTRRQLGQLQQIPTTAQSLKDAQASRAALSAINSMERAFIETAPPEYAVIPQRLARGTLGYFTGLEKANERYTTRRNLFMQSIAQVVGDQDKRFNETELKLLNEALPSTFTRKSTARDAFAEMRRQVKAKFGAAPSGPGQGGPGQGTQGQPPPSPDADAARRRLEKRFPGTGTTP